MKAAVVGVGYLGNFHAQKYHQLAGIELYAVCDVNQARADELASQYQCIALTDYRNIKDHADVVSIVTTTPYHYEIARFCLENGIHVLLEKPMTSTIAQADELIALANKHNLVLQVGHLERFNPTIVNIRSVLNQPRFIESIRIAPFQLRGTDVNVVLDLMIHDLDIVMELVNSDITEIRATGAPVLSDKMDIVNARVEFANGCVANLVASRVSLKRERKLRIFQEDGYLSVDLEKKSYARYWKTGDINPLGIPNISHEVKQ